jgi:hypothetical protein
VEDRAGQGSADAGDRPDPLDHQLPEFVDAGRLGLSDDVVRSGNRLGTTTPLSEAISPATSSITPTSVWTRMYATITARTQDERPGPTWR